MAIVERSLSDEKNGQISQWSLNDLSMISQWSSSDLHGHQGLLKVILSFQNNLLMIAKGRNLSERSTNAQGVLKECSMISSISQWTPNFSTLKEGWLRDQTKCTRISHRNGFFIVFERSLRDRAYFWSLNGHPPISVLFKASDFQEPAHSINGDLLYCVYICTSG